MGLLLLSHLRTCEKSHTCPWFEGGLHIKHSPLSASVVTLPDVAKGFRRQPFHEAFPLCSHMDGPRPQGWAVLAGGAGSWFPAWSPTGCSPWERHPPNPHRLRDTACSLRPKSAGCERLVVFTSDLGCLSRMRLSTATFLCGFLAWCTEPWQCVHAPCQHVVSLGCSGRSWVGRFHADSH